MKSCFEHQVEHINCTREKNSIVRSETLLHIHYRKSTMNSSEEKSFQERTYLLWYDSITSYLNIGGQTSVLITSIGCIVIVNTYLKMLHETIKKLLNIVLLHNVLTASTVTSLMTYMMTSHSQDFMMCSIWLATGANVFVTRFGIALLSFLRYHISWKISKCETTKNVSKHRRSNSALNANEKANAQ